MHDPENDGSDNKGVGHPRGRVCDLVAELLVVVIDPAAWDDGTVKAGDRRLSEETGEQVASDTADGVRRENLSYSLRKGMC